MHRQMMEFSGARYIEVSLKRASTKERERGAEDTEPDAWEPRARGLVREICIYIL